MNNFTPLKIFVFIIITLFSCQSADKSPISEYKITRTDFDDILTIEGFVEPTQSISIACPGNTDGIISKIIEEGTRVEEGDTLAVIEDKGLITDYNENLTKLENANAELSKSKADLEMQYAIMEAQVKTNETDTEIANLDSVQMRYLTPNQRKIRELELKQAAIEKKKLQTKLVALGEINRSEIRKLELTIQQIQNQLESSKRRIDALTLTAPKSGVVVLATHMITRRKITVGDPIWDNMPVAAIPESKNMKVRIYATETNYKRINIDDTVSYTFDAMPRNTATGRITMKSPVGQPITQKSKVKLFEIEASIDSSLVLPDPGFTANCNIILNKVRDTIVIPQIAIYEKDSMRVVYVKSNNGYEMRQIISGISSPRNSVIVAGLKPNEIISLIEPESKLIKKKTVLPDSLKHKYSTQL